VKDRIIRLVKRGASVVAHTLAFPFVLIAWVYLWPYLACKQLLRKLKEALKST